MLSSRIVYPRALEPALIAEIAIAANREISLPRVLRFVNQHVWNNGHTDR